MKRIERVALRMAKRLPRQDMTQKENAELLLAEHFEAPGFDELPEILRELMFRSSIDIGAERAIIALQATIHQNVPLRKIDGDLGPATYAALDHAILTPDFHERLTDHLLFACKLIAAHEQTSV